MTAGLAKLCPWIATPRSSRSTVSGRFVGQEVDIFGQSQGSCHLVGGVVIAGDDDDRNLEVAQAAELAHKVKPGIVVTPIAVVEVARDQYKIDGFVDGKVDQPREGASSCSANPLDGRVLVPFQPLERAIQVNIGRVDKRNRHEEELGLVVGHALIDESRIGSRIRSTPGIGPEKLAPH